MQDNASTKRLDLAIVLATVLVALLVDPRGNFPLSDDWSYAHTARLLCESGRIEFLPWTGASVLFQAGYGALLCKLGGFSFTLLRLSTIVLAAGGAIALNHMLASLAVGAATRRLAVAVLALNPLYLSQSFTFMTDVPFTAFALIAAALYVAGLQSRRLQTLVLASVIAAASILIRQHGVFLVVAAAVAILVERDRGWGVRLRAIFAASTVPALAFIGFHLWLFGAHGTPAGLQNKMSEMSLGATVAIIDHAFRAAATLGFAVLPMAAALASRMIPQRKRIFAGATVLLGVGAVLAYANDGATMFYLPNVQYDFGLGASTLRDTLFLSMPEPLELGVGLAIPLTLAALFSAGVLAAGAWRWWTWYARADRAFVALAALALFAGSLLHGAFYFDRYLIPVIPFAISAMALDKADDRVAWPAVVLTALLAVYAVAGTHDYMEMNRARFGVLEDLEATGVDASRIDGGFEYNAWRSAHDLTDWPTKESASRGQSADKKSWWWVRDDEYIVSSSVLEGYRTAESRSYSTWLRPGLGRILLLERSPPP